MPKAPFAHTRSQLKPENARAGITGALLRRAGVEPEDQRESDYGQEHKLGSIPYAAGRVLESRGLEVPMDYGSTIRAAVSHGDLGEILSSVVNKVLVKSFEEAADSTDGWVSVVDVKDFKEQSRPRLSKLGGLEKLPRGGTAKHADPSDDHEEYKIARFASQISLDEMDLIDDDTNALLQLPRELGAAAARIRLDLVYSILLANGVLSDGTALFHSDHANLLSGASSALTGSSLQSAISMMSKQSENGVPLNVRAAYLVVPPDLRFLALQLLNSAEVRNPAATSEHGTANPIHGESIQLRSDARLGSAGVTDPDTGQTYAGSAANWFLSASPSTGPTIEVGYRMGTGRKPVVRPFVLDQGQWGLGWDVAMDIGAKALDHRGLLRSAGS